MNIKSILSVAFFSILVTLDSTPVHAQNPGLVVSPRSERSVRAPKKPLTQTLPQSGTEFVMPKDAQRSAWGVWSDLMESSMTFEKKPITVVGTEQVFMFGGEKEGSSSRITRVMGPDSNEFKKLIETMDEAKQQEFIRELMEGWSAGRYRNKAPVVDANGNKKIVDPGTFKGKDYRSLPFAEVKKDFDSWLKLTEDRPFSFLNQTTRSKMFNGQFAGMTGSDHWGKGNYNKKAEYTKWKPHFGDAERFLSDAHGTSVGWEMNFKPQRSYGEFEEMISWYRNSLSHQGVLFEAPGHQWIVFPEYKNLASNTEADQKVRNKLADIYQNMQAHTVLSGIEGGTGIEIADFKDLQTTESLKTHETWRGVLRLERNRFQVDGVPSFNLEQRAGTKLDKNRRFLQSCLISRYATAEFDDLGDAAYELHKFEKGNLAKRFGLSDLEVRQAIANIQSVEMSKMKGGYEQTRKLQEEFWLPFWNWEKSPYVSPAKSEELKKLTQSFVKNLAAMKDPTLEGIRAHLKTWVASSDLKRDIETYLKPKPPSFSQNPEFGGFASKNPRGVDVNQVDLGIEYTARFPTRTKVVLSENPLPETGKKAWITTQADLSVEEKKKVIEDLAEDLAQRMNGGKKTPITSLSDPGHGHSMVIAYEFRDPNNQKWRVEWDGVGRDYDQNGKLIDKSIRGGHIEVVTPKFNPESKSVGAVFDAFEAKGMKPSFAMGGGHINVDLAVFEGRPKAMARFLSVFLENRATIGMLYQHPGRLASAEPHTVSKNLLNKLKDFNGTESELKKLLYDEKFFNTRLGRKTKYTQLDVSAYFQDIIPPEYLTTDFDLKNDPWRKTFNVDPKIRKAEFRLFGAPRTPSEAESQIKLVRSMIDYALDESAPLSGVVQEVNYESWAKNPKKAEEGLAKLTSQLGLNPEEYRGYLYDGLRITEDWRTSPSYVPYSEKMALFPRTENWNPAVAARPPTQSIRAEDHRWTGTVDEESKKLFDLRRGAAARAELLREEMNSVETVNLTTQKLPSRTTILEAFNERQLAALEPLEALDLLRLHSKRLKPEEVERLTSEIVSRISSWNLSYFDPKDPETLSYFFDPKNMKQSAERSRFIAKSLLQHGDDEVASALLRQLAFFPDAEVSGPVLEELMKLDDARKASLFQSADLSTILEETRGLKGLSEFTQSIDLKKLPPGSEDALVRYWSDAAQRFTKPAELKTAYLTQKGLTRGTPAAHQALSDLMKHPDEKVRNAFLKSAIRRNDKEGIKNMLSGFLSSSDSERKIASILLDESFPKAFGDIERIQAPDLPLYLKAAYERSRDPKVPLKERQALAEKLDRLLSRPQPVPLLDQTLQLYLENTKDREFARWLAERAQKAGKSSLTLAAIERNPDPQVRKDLLKFQYEATPKQTMQFIKNRYDHLEIPRKAELLGDLTELKLTAVQKKTVGEMAKNLFESYPWGLSKDQIKGAAKALDLKYKNADDFTRLADGLYDESLKKQLYRFAAVHQLKTTKVGTPAYHAATTLAAGNLASDPVVSYLAMESIRDELGPSGKRAMQYLAESDYPRLSEGAKDYLKRYQQKLRTLTLEELAQVPPYERVLLARDLKSVRAKDAGFLQKLNEQESRWLASLPEEQIPGLMRYVGADLGDPKLPKDLQQTYADLYSRLPLSKESRLLHAGTLMGATDPIAVKQIMGSLSGMSIQELETLLPASGSREAGTQLLERMVSHPDLARADFNHVDSARKRLWDRLGALLAQEGSGLAQGRVRAAFKKLPDPVRSGIYLDMKSEILELREGWGNQLEWYPQNKALLELFGGESPEFAEGILKQINPGADSLSFLKKLKERHQARGRSATECNVFLDVLRAVGGTSGP